MNILFMGTTDFAVRCLDAVRSAGHRVCAVVTKPDQPKNRGMKLMQSPVKDYALAAELPVLQPASLKTEETQAALRTAEADVFVVVAYGKLLPKAVLEMPRLGCINVHGSLLPAYRGAAPIQWAVLNGERETGVSTMYLAEEMDAGDVLGTAALELRPCESFGSVYSRLMELGAGLLVQTLEKLEAGACVPMPQDAARVSYAPPIGKELCPTDFTRSAARVAAHICGLDPKPGATALFGGVTYKLFAPQYSELRTELPPGSIVDAGKRGLLLACGGGETLLVTELQVPGGKRMRAADYLRGHRLG